MSPFYLFRFYIQHRQKIILFLCLISNLGFLFMYFLVIYQPKKKYQYISNRPILIFGPVQFIILVLKLATRYGFLHKIYLIL